MKYRTEASHLLVRDKARADIAIPRDGPRSAAALQGARERRLQPPGLRVRKKAEQQVRLLAAAMALFRENGYDGTRVEDIAVMANVSTKTVYNYFATKLDILIELLNGDRLRLTASYERVVNDPPADPAEGFAQLMQADIGDDFSPEDKKLWRELIAASLLAYEGSWAKVESNQKMFTKYIHRLLAHYVAAGSVSKRITPAVAVDIVYAVHAQNFRQFCAVAARKPADVLRQTRQQMRHLLMGWANEPGGGRERQSIRANGMPTARAG